MSLRNWGWFIIIQKTKPLIGRHDESDELKMLEEKANSAYGAYEEALKITKELDQANKIIEEEKVTLTKQLEAEQGNLSQYQERQALAAARKADLENQLESSNLQLSSEEQARQDMTADKKKMEGEITIIKKRNWRFRDCLSENGARKDQ